MLTGCATKEKPAETPAPSRSSSLSPTEKSVPGALTPGPQPGSGQQTSAATARPEIEHEPPRLHKTYQAPRDGASDPPGPEVRSAAAAELGTSTRTESTCPPGQGLPVEGTSDQDTRPAPAASPPSAPPDDAAPPATLPPLPNEAPITISQIASAVTLLRSADSVAMV
jgi:hypothetical protein